ncbi:hypothetical protein VTO73DRAFT_9046 [Trametes versicolor]
MQDFRNQTRNHYQLANRQNGRQKDNGRFIHIRFIVHESFGRIQEPHFHGTKHPIIVRDTILPEQKVQIACAETPEVAAHSVMSKPRNSFPSRTCLTDKDRTQRIPQDVFGRRKHVTQPRSVLRHHKHVAGTPKIEHVENNTQVCIHKDIARVKFGDRNTAQLIPRVHTMERIWDAYKTAQASFWTADEIDLSADVRHWTCRLTDEERAFISILLAFFAASDGMVNENLLERFCAEVQIPEARCFYGFQIMMENIHAETYASMLTTLIQDNAERDRLFSATSTIPAIKAKAEWTMRWIEDKHQPFAVRLIAFAAVEGIFFSSSFAAIFWLRSRGLLPGICHSNELIARDESMHTMFACLLYSQLQTRAPKATVRAVIREAVALEKSFFADALPTRLAGMNTELMGDYVEAVADDLLRRLGCRPIYDKENPFPFITSSALDGRTNFFERRVSEYSAVSHMHSNAINADLDRPPRESDFILLDDF